MSSFGKIIVLFIICYFALLRPQITSASMLNEEEKETIARWLWLWKEPLSSLHKKLIRIELKKLKVTSKKPYFQFMQLVSPRDFSKYRSLRKFCTQKMRLKDNPFWRNVCGSLKTGKNRPTSQEVLQKWSERLNKIAAKGKKLSLTGLLYQVIPFGVEYFSSSYPTNKRQQKRIKVKKLLLGVITSFARLLKEDKDISAWKKLVSVAIRYAKTKHVSSEKFLRNKNIPTYVKALKRRNRIHIPRQSFNRLNKELLRLEKIYPNMPEIASLGADIAKIGESHNNRIFWLSSLEKLASTNLWGFSYMVSHVEHFHSDNIHYSIPIKKKSGVSLLANVKELLLRQGSAKAQLKGFFAVAIQKILLSSFATSLHSKGLELFRKYLLKGKTPLSSDFAFSYANVLKKNQHYDLAEKFYLKSWNKKRSNRTLRAIVSLYGWDQNKPKKAIVFLNRILKKEPKNQDAIANRAAVYGLLLKDHKKAYADYKRLLSFGKQTNPWHFVSASNYFSDRVADYIQARKTIEKGIKLHPKAYFLFRSYGKILRKLKLFKKAEVAYETAINHQSTLRLLTEYAFFLTKRKKRKKAISIYQNILKQRPNNWVVREELVILLRKVGKSKEAEKVLGKTRNVKYLFYESQQAMFKQKFRKAIRYNTLIIQKFPEQKFKAYINRAGAYAKLGFAKQAIADYKAALIIQPNSYYANTALVGYFMNHHKNYEEAKAVLIRYLRIRPTDTLAMYELANIHIKAKEYQAAIDLLRTQLQQQKSKSGLINKMASIYIKHMQKPKLGFQLWKDYLAEYPKDTEVLMNRAEEYIKSREFEKAVQDLQRLIQIKPTDDYHIRMSNVYLFGLKNYKKAIGVWDSYIEMFPKKSFGYFRRARTNRLLKNKNVVIKDLRKLISLFPQKAYFVSLLAHTFKKAKQFGKAAKVWSDYLKKEPGNSSAYIARAFLFERMKSFRKALLDWKKLEKTSLQTDLKKKAKRGITRCLKALNNKRKIKNKKRKVTQSKVL